MITLGVRQIENGWLVTYNGSVCYCADVGALLDAIKKICG